MVSTHVYVTLHSSFSLILSCVFVFFRPLFSNFFCTIVSGSLQKSAQWPESLLYLIRLIETREPGSMMEHSGCTVIYVTDPRDLLGTRLYCSSYCEPFVLFRNMVALTDIACLHVAANFVSSHRTRACVHLHKGPCASLFLVGWLLDFIFQEALPCYCRIHF